MSDDREFWTDDHLENEAEDRSADDLDAFDDSDLSPETHDEDDYPLLSTDAFESELEALAAYAGDEIDIVEAEQDSAEASEYEDLAEVQTASTEDDTSEDEETAGEDAYAGGDVEPEDDAGFNGTGVIATPADVYADDAVAVDEETSRLRQPRAGRFRRMVQNQLGMLPLALLLLGMGAYLLARGQNLEGLPDLADGTLAGISATVVGFAAVFHSLLSGRRERGLLFAGLWLLATVGLIAVLIYGVEDDPAIGEWWPLGLWSAGLAFVFTYLIERAHDARLMLLGMGAFVAGTTAYLVSSDRIDSETMNDVVDYWPLLLSVIGVGLLPLVFQRRTE